MDITSICLIVLAAASVLIVILLAYAIFILASIARDVDLAVEMLNLKLPEMASNLTDLGDAERSRRAQTNED